MIAKWYDLTFNKLWCRWFGHKSQLSIYTFSHYEKKDIDDDWVIISRHQELKNCARCGEVLDKMEFIIGGDIEPVEGLYVYNVRLEKNK